MKRWLSSSLLAVVLQTANLDAADPASSSVAGAVAKPAPGSSTPAAAPPVRPVSPNVAELLRGAAPKYTPPPETKPATAQNAGAETETTDSERPRNGIVRLPRYLVEEPKIFLPNRRDVLTPRGQLELAMKRHPGLRFGNIWFIRNDGIALFMLYEEERLERLRELNDMLSVLPDSQYKRAKDFAVPLALRHSEWVDAGGSFQAWRQR